MSAACPRLRALEMFPTERDGARVLCLRDPVGLSDRLAFLPDAAVVIVSACDGRRSAAEVAQLASRRLGGAVLEDHVHALLAQLDEALLLDSPRFRAHRARVLGEFRAQPVRHPAHAGLSYSDAPAELAALLDAELTAAGQRAATLPEQAPRLILAPHIDFTRGAAVYADAYWPLARLRPAYDLIVVFGTDHQGHAEPFSLTRKSYATPLGTVHTDVALVDALTEELGEAHFEEELNHRREHSIEFQAVWLRHVLGAACPPLLPVLCGPFAEAGRDGRPTLRAEVPRFLTALARRIAHRRVLVVAGADLAHVGPRFGDAAFGARECAEVEAADREALTCVARGDGDGFFAAVMAEGDRFRVCGTSPITAALGLVGGAPEAHIGPTWALCPADDEDESWVSVAALVLW